VNAVTVDGDGLAAPIEIDTATGDGARLYELVERTGLYETLYEAGSIVLTGGAPTTDLGPRVVLTWRLPTSSTEAASIVQEVYPYASVGPVVHTRPGQLGLPGQVTDGGWHRAPPSLVTTMQRIGVPSRAALEATEQAAREAAAPSVARVRPEGSPSRWPLVAIVGVASLVLLLPGLRPLTRRRAMVT
jgi:hypothetical protein